MAQILQAEWYKLRKSKISWVFVVGPLIALFSGLSATMVIEKYEINEWYLTLMVMNFTYALLFLPLLTGVLAGLICRYEHQAGGWKQLLATPITRGQIFVAKYVILMAVILIIQLIYLVAVFAVGWIKGFSDPFPFAIIWKTILGGWLATFPLVALQLGLSVMWKSFAAPFAVNVVFTLPNIFAVNSDQFGPYYPWAQPFLMMYIGGGEGDTFFVPWEQVITVVGGSLVLFFVAGYMYFLRKPV